MLRSGIFGVIKSMGSLHLGAQPQRNTVVLRRLIKLPLHKKNHTPRKMKHRYLIYRVVENRNLLEDKVISIILTRDVPGYGEKSDVIDIKQNVGYRELLLPGLAVYNSPKNYAKYNCDLEAQTEKYKSISLDVHKTVKYLSNLILYITMNNAVPWTLQPSNIRMALRRNHVHVPEHAIEMHPGEISGPNLDLQNKEFFVTVTINKKDRVNVRCRIHPWEMGEKQIPLPEKPWELKLEPLFEDQAEILSKMPLVEQEDVQQ